MPEYFPSLPSCEVGLESDYKMSYHERVKIFLGCQHHVHFLPREKFLPEMHHNDILVCVYVNAPQLIRERNCLLEELPTPLRFSVFFDWFVQQLRPGEVLAIVHTDVDPGHAETSSAPGDALEGDAGACRTEISLSLGDDSISHPALAAARMSWGEGDVIILCTGISWTGGSLEVRMLNGGF